MDLQSAFDEGFEAICGYVNRSFAAFEKRIVALERREPLCGEKGDKGEPGEPGRAGDDGKDGRDGLDGSPGKAGRDGLDVKDLFRAEGGRLVAVMSDGTTKDLGEYVGKDGLPGEHGSDGAPGLDGKDGTAGADGRDGLGFDDLNVEYDGERSFKFVWSRGDVVKQAEWRVPVMIYRGVFADEVAYEPGDTVTWAGSLWVCRDAETEGKPDTSKGWTLAAKRGRDGREAKTAQLHQPKVKI